MILLTERAQIRLVAERFESDWLDRVKRPDDFNDMLEKLRALDVETATAADVASITGSPTWVSMSSCDECHEETFDAARLGCLGNCVVCESCAVVCLKCLRKAAHDISQGSDHE